MPYVLNLATRRYYNQSRLRILLWGMLLISVLCTGIGTAQYLDDRSRATRLAAENMRLQQLTTTIPSQSTDQLQKRHAALSRLLARRATSRLKLLDSLEAATPDGVSYSLIAPDAGKQTVRLEGDVSSMKTLSLLLKRLHTADGLHNPTLVSTGDLGSRPFSDHTSGTGFIITVEASAL